MKKVWIAGILATLMLLMPITSVVGANEVEDCFECQPVDRFDVLKVRLLLIKIEAVTNVILSRFGHIPEVQEKHEDLSKLINNLIDIFNEPSSWCDFLEDLIIGSLAPIAIIGFIEIIFSDLFPKIYPLIENMFNFLYDRIRKRTDKICNLYENVHDCGDYWLCP